MAQRRRSAKSFLESGEGEMITKQRLEEIELRTKAAIEDLHLKRNKNATTARIMEFINRCPKDVPELIETLKETVRLLKIDRLRKNKFGGDCGCPTCEFLRKWEEKC
jgi:hypothetical protein